MGQNIEVFWENGCIFEMDNPFFLIFKPNKCLWTELSNDVSLIIFRQILQKLLAIHMCQFELAHPVHIIVKLSVYQINRKQYRIGIAKNTYL